MIQFAVMPGADASAHFELGRRLAPLAREGVLVLASGSLTHNLGEMVPGAPENAALPHVAEFSDWFAGALRRERNRRPARLGNPRAARRRAHPTPEHLLPLFVALGAAGPTERRPVRCIAATSSAPWRWMPGASIRRPESP
jgi:4,5-DOPA dioxygenase extradiol